MAEFISEVFLKFPEEYPVWPENEVQWNAVCELQCHYSAQFTEKGSTR